MSTSESYKNIYLQEAQELISDIEDTILDIENDSENTEALNRIFRAIHTIKGSGAMAGFDNIASFSHHIETALDKVRKNIVPVTKKLIDLILDSLDMILIMLKDDDEADKVKINEIISAFEAVSQTNDIHKNTESYESNKAILEQNDTGKDKTYKIKFQPSYDLFASGTNPLLLIDEMRDLGLCMTETTTTDIPVIHDMDPEACYFSWHFTLTTNLGINAIQDIFLFIEDTCEISIHEIQDIDENLSEDSKESLIILCEKLLETGYITAQEFHDVMSGQTKTSDLLINTGIISDEEVKSGLDPAKILKKSAKTLNSTSIRVPLNKLDHLVNVAAELTITQARLLQIFSDIKDIKIRRPLKTAERLIDELRNSILEIRMVPIGTTFSQFRRYVRDMMNELGKEIELITRGTDTELDKTIIEQLNDSLVHLIRNSIDHGIELPEKRKKAGKPPKGKICLSAMQKGSMVVITIEDDGAGLDSEQIKLKAQKMGIIKHSELSEQEIYNLLFVPGFSTSEKITSLSGRGVGMDVVKRAIDSLQGTIKINSKKNHGTCVSIALPLTLAIIEGLLIETGDNLFIIPINMVDKCTEIKNNKLTKSGSRNMVSIDKELIPIIYLRELFNLNGQRPLIEQVVIVDTENFKAGIVTDRIIGDHQTIVKSLGKTFQNAQGISGATIMGDGSVALILDVPGLIRCAESDEKFN